MNKNYSVKCCRCGKDKFFKNKNSYYSNRNKKSVCMSCKHELHSEKMSGRKREFTEQWKQNLRKSLMNSEKWKDSMNSDEYRQKHREKIQRLVKDSYGSQVYNKKSCKFFNMFEQMFGYDGMYATKNGEKSVIGFWVDYYDPHKNFVIEWDEKRHFKNGKLKNKDVVRQRKIIDELNCDFYRIKESTGEVTIVRGSDMVKNQIFELWNKNENKNEE